MRVAAVTLAIVLAAVGGASADPPHSTQSGLEAGYLWTHFDNTTVPGGWNLNGDVIRASAYAAKPGHMYLAAELDVGWLSGSGVNAGVPVQTTSRTLGAGASTTAMPTTTDTANTTVGRLVQAKVVGGWRTLRGPIGLAVEVAAGLREVMLGDTRFAMATSAQTDGIIEARGRAYLWLGRTVTLGAVAGVNVVQRDNLTVGVMLGIHMPRR